MNIDGKVFIVTGGASGLGEGVVRQLHALGGLVLVADLQDDKGQSLATELGLAYQHCDVCSADEAQAAVDATLKLGTLSGLINCAGIAPAMRTVGSDGPHTLELFQRVIGINLVGSFNMIRLAAQAMAGNTPEPTGERGVIVSTASISAYEGQIGQAAYAASKGGVVGMTLPIARDLARHGIRNMAIAPGAFGTPMIRSMPDAVQDSLAASVPFPPRLGRPEDFARLVQHIIENDMLNGEVIRLDGAARLTPR